MEKSLRYWPFVRGIHRPMPPHKGQWRGALMFSLICAWINGWVNNRESGDLIRHRTQYNVTVMLLSHCPRVTLYRIGVSHHWFEQWLGKQCWLDVGPIQEYHSTHLNKNTTVLGKKKCNWNCCLQNGNHFVSHIICNMKFMQVFSWLIIWMWSVKAKCIYYSRVAFTNKNN